MGTLQRGITSEDPLIIPSSECIYIQQRVSHVIGLVFRVTDINTNTEIGAEVMVSQSITHPNGLDSKNERFVSHSSSYKKNKPEYVVKLVDVGGLTQANISTERLPEFDNIKELLELPIQVVAPPVYEVVRECTIIDDIDVATKIDDIDVATKIDALFLSAPAMYDSSITGDNIKKRTVGIIQQIRDEIAKVLTVLKLKIQVTFRCLYIKRTRIQNIAYFSNTFYNDLDYLKSLDSIFVKIDGIDYINKEDINDDPLNSIGKPYNSVKKVTHLDYNPAHYTNLFIDKDFGNGNITAGNILECVDINDPDEYLFTDERHIINIFETKTYTRPKFSGLQNVTGGIKYKKYKTRRKQRKRRSSGYYTIVNRRKMNKTRAYN